MRDLWLYTYPYSDLFCVGWEFICLCYIGLVDSRSHKIPRIAIGMLIVPLILFAPLYHVIDLCLITAVLAWGIYFLGYYCGKLGRGDLKFAPVLAALITLNSFQISQMSLLIRISTEVFEDDFLLNTLQWSSLLSHIVMTVIWIVLSQIITIISVILRKVLFKVGWSIPIAHGPAMIIGATLLCLIETWIHLRVMRQ